MAPGGRAMIPPARYSVSPPPSCATRPPGLPKPLPLSVQIVDVLAWFGGRRPTWGQRQREDQIAIQMARMIDVEEGAN
jgi:hypothetical protein